MKRKTSLIQTIFTAARDWLSAEIAAMSPSVPVIRGGFAFCVFINSKGDLQMQVQGPNILRGQTFGFILAGTVNPGDTFVEPTLKDGSGNNTNGTYTLNPSVTVPSDGSAGVSPVPAGYVGAFQTTGTYTASVDRDGTYSLEADVLGVDNSELSGTVSAPLPETVGFLATGFTVGPVPGAPADSTPPAGSTSGASGGDTTGGAASAAPILPPNTAASASPPAATAENAPAAGTSLGAE